MASATLSAQERQRELAVLLERTEAQNQQRGQCSHPQPGPCGSELSLKRPLTSCILWAKRYFKPLSSPSHFASQRSAFIFVPRVVEDRLVLSVGCSCAAWLRRVSVAVQMFVFEHAVVQQTKSHCCLSDTFCSTCLLMYLVKKIIIIMEPRRTDIVSQT